MASSSTRRLTRSSASGTWVATRATSLVSVSSAGAGGARLRGLSAEGSRGPEEGAAVVNVLLVEQLCW